MSRSTYEQPLPAARLAEVALPHDGSGAPLAGGPHTYPEMAAAGLWTTPSDLARYAIGVQRSFAGENDALIRARTARDMLVPVVANHGVGPVIGGLPTRKYFMHGGSNAGYRCVLVAYTDGRGIVIMTNGDNGSELFGDVIRTVAHLYRWPDHAPPERVLASAAPARLSRYTGAYLLNDGATLVIHDAGGKLVGQTPKSPPYELFPSSEREFFARVSDTVVSFGVAADGVVAEAKLRVGGFERAGPRLEGMRAKPLVEAAARTWRRIADQKPMPESEAALRNLFAGLASGKPAYDTMGEDFAALTRRMMPFLQAETVKLGELKSLVFVRVGSRGEDVFHADFEHGRRRADILFDDRGRIDNVMVQDR
jgi:hypothetical protein